MTKNNLVIFDFGSQTTHLIGRRLAQMSLSYKIVDPEISLKRLLSFNPVGLILSGGPKSVYQKNSPKIGFSLSKLGIPILGICYGWQYLAQSLSGKVKSGKKEYGPEKISFNSPKNPITKNLPKKSQVWMSHGDSVVKLPKGFNVIGSTPQLKSAFCAHQSKPWYGVQFHPEVKPTEHGMQILKNFTHICGLKTKPRRVPVERLIKKIKSKVKNDKVIAAVSGGVDSTVTAALIAKAIGKSLIPVYIESGLMRQNTLDWVQKSFSTLGLKPVVIYAQKDFLKALKGATDPEEKRKIIGQLYINLFEKEAQKHPKAKWLAQGTIYSDVIESKGSKHASKIKSHHNVGGLPQKMNLKLIEPLRQLYKDEVRKLGKKLDLSSEIINQQPFPGPGQAIRIIGEINQKRLNKQQQADQIVLEELKKAGWLEKVFQSFPVMTGIKSTAVKGDSRVYAEVVALRIYGSTDIMTASWSHLPYDLLQRLSSRIVNEVNGVSRVVYDITTKPPATMEWE